ncbi:NAC transcription factor NAM-B1-like [Miscanthus floridulus]|uniref:NAC transcription factor NAM-B1-like n=1 Tax=Miscanthus floridulus TaxID=154761 RepID=UPI00345AFCB3
MAQTPGGTTAPVQAPDRVPQPISELPAGYVFHPKARSLLKSYLITRARGGAIKDPYGDTVADGVDVYAVRPEALPFPRRNRSLHDHVWAYFFTTRPAGAAGIGAAEGGGEDDDVRDVAAGGCWRRYGGGDKEYIGRDGEVYAFRRRFAFHEAGARGKKTVWRMKEFRLKETAPRFRGVVFHPNAKGLVIWKVWNQVIPEEEPAVDYYGMNDEDDEEEEEEIGPVVITVGDPAAAPNA